MFITGELQLEKKPPRRQAAPDISRKGHLAPAVSSGAAVGHGCVTQTAPHWAHRPPESVTCAAVTSPVLRDELGTGVSALPWLRSALRLFVVLALGAEFKVWAEVKNAVPSLNHHRVRFHLLISTEHLSHRYQFLAHITNCSRVMPGINLFVRIFQWGSTGQSTTYSFHRGFI